MNFIAAFAIGLALNMDACGTGISYGMRKIKIPFTSVLILSSMSVLSIATSITAGNLISNYISPTLGPRLGGIILLIIGLWVLVQAICEQIKDNGHPLVSLRIRSMGLVIKVLRDPASADLDASGTLNSKEAALLGAALALDALGIGLAVSMMGFNPFLITTLVGLGHISLTYLGLFMGRKLGANPLGQKLSFVPGFILILMGVVKLR